MNYKKDMNNVGNKRKTRLKKGKNKNKLQQETKNDEEKKKKDSFNIFMLFPNFNFHYVTLLLYGSERGDSLIYNYPLHPQPDDC